MKRNADGNEFKKNDTLSSDAVSGPSQESGFSLDSEVLEEPDLPVSADSEDGSGEWSFADDEDVLADFHGKFSEGSVTVSAGPYLFILLREDGCIKVCISEGGTVLSLVPFPLSEDVPEYMFGFRGYFFNMSLSKATGVVSLFVTRKKEKREDNLHEDRE